MLLPNLHIADICKLGKGINASIIGFPLGPTPGTPTGMQVLLLIIDISFFPQTPGKWHYLVNRNFTPGLLINPRDLSILSDGEIYIVFYFILYEVPVYTSILEISLHKSKVCATFHCSIKNYWQIFHCPKLR